MRCVLVSMLILTVAIPTGAALPWSKESGAQITMNVQHEAMMKTPLNQIAFAEPTGKCADLLTDALVADFAQSGAIVIDRINFKRIMAEHKLNLGGAIDEKTAAKIGRLIGTGSLVFVKVHDCSTYKTKEMRNSVNGIGVKKIEVPTTRGSMKASIQVVNLTTGVTSAARLIDAKASLSADQMDRSKMSRMKDAAVSFLNGATQYQEYPADEDAQTLLFGNAVEQVHHLLFPWTETKQFFFYGDSECALNVALQLMQTGDYDGASREAESALETCRSATPAKPAVLARAYYNRGMAYYITEDYTNALTNLSQAARLDSNNKTFTEALATCNKARVESLTKGGAKQEPGKGGQPLTAQAKPQTTAVAAVSTAKPSPEERLRRLDDLHRKRLISDDEYDRKRKEILADM